MRIVAGFADIPNGRVRFRELGHGHAVDNTSGFEMQFSKDELEDVLREPYRIFLEEAREEFAFEGETDPKSIAALDFPSLRAVIDDHESVLRELILDYMFFPLLEGSLDNSERSDFDFVINKLTSLRSSDNHVFIGAEVYERVSRPDDS